jgi:hypothetical protein
MKRPIFRDLTFTEHSYTNVDVRALCAGLNVAQAGTAEERQSTRIDPTQDHLRQSACICGHSPPTCIEDSVPRAGRKNLISGRNNPKTGHLETQSGRIPPAPRTQKPEKTSLSRPRTTHSVQSSTKTPPAKPDKIPSEPVARSSPPPILLLLLLVLLILRSPPYPFTSASPTFFPSIAFHSLTQMFRNRTGFPWS